MPSDSHSPLKHPIYKAYGGMCCAQMAVAALAAALGVQCTVRALDIVRVQEPRADHRV